MTLHTVMNMHRKHQIIIITCARTQRGAKKAPPAEITQYQIGKVGDKGNCKITITYII
jgi:hypothetical protein